MESVGKCLEDQEVHTVEFDKSVEMNNVEDILMPWICKKIFQCWNRALTDSLHKIVFPFNLINVLNNLIASHSQQLSTMLCCTYKHLVNHCSQQLLITVVGTLSMSALVPTTLKQIYYCYLSITTNSTS